MINARLGFRKWILAISLVGLLGISSLQAQGAEDLPTDTPSAPANFGGRMFTILTTPFVIGSPVATAAAFYVQPDFPAAIIVDTEVRDVSSTLVGQKLTSVQGPPLVSSKSWAFSLMLSRQALVPQDIGYIAEPGKQYRVRYILVNTATNRVIEEAYVLRGEALPRDQYSVTASMQGGTLIISGIFPEGSVIGFAELANYAGITDTFGTVVSNGPNQATYDVSTLCRGPARDITINVTGRKSGASLNVLLHTDLGPCGNGIALPSQSQ